MRISNANSYDAAIANLQRRQGEMSESQLQLTSGKRVNRASDDPTAAARAERALATEARSKSTQRAVDASRNAMTLGESALGDAADLMQQARDFIVAAGNATYTDAERRGVAASLRELRRQLFDVANRSDGAGAYLFGGQGSSAPPFVDVPGGVQFRGVAGHIDAAPGESLPLTLDGLGAWLQARTGNGVFETRVGTSTGSASIDTGTVTDPSAITGDPYSVSFSVAGGVTTYSVLRNGAAMVPPMANLPYTAGSAIEVDGMSFEISGAPADGDSFDIVPSTASLSVFDVLDRTAADLEQPGRSGGQIAQTVAFGLRDVDASMARLSAERTQAGDALNRIDAAADRLDDLVLKAKTERSDAEDLDMVEAVSNFQTQQSGYDAALKSYSMVQRLSLFQYLSI